MNVRLVFFLFISSLRLLAQCPDGQWRANWRFLPSEGDNTASVDVYLEGMIAGARGEETVYSAEIIARYPPWRKRVGCHPAAESRQYLRIAPYLEFFAGEGPLERLDRFRPAIEFTWIRDALSHGSRPLVRSRQWITQFGGEFDRKFDTKSVIATSFYRWEFSTLPDQPRGPAKLALSNVPTFDAGMELGNNFQNRVRENGSGLVARLYAAVNDRQELLTKRAALVGTYQYRGPLRQEVAVQRINRESINLLTAKPRHFVEVGLEFPFSGINVKPVYRWGSLPPAFDFLDHSYAVSLEFKAKASR
jgi:hypothetical protein